MFLTVNKQSCPMLFCLPIIFMLISFYVTFIFKCGGVNFKFFKFYPKIFWCHKKCSALYFQKKVDQTDHRNWSTYSIEIALQKMWNPLFALQHPHGKTLVIVTSVSPEGLLQCHKCLLCVCACVGVGVCVCFLSHRFRFSHMISDKSHAINNASFHCGFDTRLIRHPE